MTQREDKLTKNVPHFPHRGELKLYRYLIVHVVDTLTVRSGSRTPPRLLTSCACHLHGVWHFESTHKWHWPSAAVTRSHWSHHVFPLDLWGLWRGVNRNPSSQCRVINPSLCGACRVRPVMVVSWPRLLAISVGWSVFPSVNSTLRWPC